MGKWPARPAIFGVLPGANHKTKWPDGKADASLPPSRPMYRPLEQPEINEEKMWRLLKIDCRRRLSANLRRQGLGRFSNRGGAKAGGLTFYARVMARWK